MSAGDNQNPRVHSGSVKRTDKEIAALKALKYVGPFTGTDETIEFIIKALVSGVDETADAWKALSEEQRIAARDAHAWSQGLNDVRPSEGYGELVAP